MTKTVYIVGSKGIPAKYGGFETFVEKLTEFQQDKDIQYYVACMRENSAKSGITADTFEHNGAKCYNIERRFFRSLRNKCYRRSYQHHY